MPKLVQLQLLPQLTSQPAAAPLSRLLYADLIQANMHHLVRQLRSFPVLGTIPPVNPAYVDRNPVERNDWVKRMNDEIRAMAKQQQVPVADIYDAFMKKGDLPVLFADDKHPNETGYALIAQVWTRALTQPLGASTSRRGLPGLFATPGGF